MLDPVDVMRYSGPMNVALRVMAIVSLLFSSFMLLPDSHADEGALGVHIYDHVLEHGMEHFYDASDAPSEPRLDHSASHHHNCSYDVPALKGQGLAGFAPRKSFKSISVCDPLRSRAVDVLIQPPIA